MLNLPAYVIGAKVELFNSHLNEELLKYISPLEWEHFNILGKYRFSIKEIASLDSLQSLQTKKPIILLEYRK
ncbi:hypothetical protein COD18_04785 [Bacillus cereus]|nr:hypothetical protein CN431_09455 [Bacillus cereus]PGT95224.1 hypothetical protein COD18_04785 [Bacillus cereus]